MPADALKCKECQTDLPPRGALRLRALLRPARGRLLAADRRAPRQLKRRIQAGPHKLWRYADFLPLEGTAALARCRPGWTPLVRADRLAERLGLGEVWVKNETANPTHSFKDRVVSVALAAPRSSASRRSPAPPRATSPTPSPPTPPPPGCPPTSSSRPTSRRQKILATGAYGTNVVAVRGNYDDVNRLCTELSGERADWAFVNVNMRPYYAEGSKTLAFEIAEQLGWELPDRIVAPDRLRLAVHEDRPRLRGVDRAAGCSTGELPTMNGAQAEGCSPGRRRRSPPARRLPPGQAGHDRQVAGDRQPGRRPVRGRARPQDGRRRSTR